MIYGPSWDRGQVVRIHPETGETIILADGFKKPGAVRFDLMDRLFILDDMLFVQSAASIVLVACVR